MKRSIGLICALLLSIIVIAGCDKEQSKTYQGDLRGSDVIDTLTYKGDKMIKQSMIMTINYKDRGVSQSDAEKIVEKQELAYKDIKGIKYEKTVKNDKAVQKVEIDYKKADLDQLKKKLSITGPEKGKDYVSVKAVERSLTKAGFEEKKPMNDE